MDFGACPECGADARLMTDCLAICSRHCGWSAIVTTAVRQGAGLWYQHMEPGRGWGRRWCKAETVS